MKRLYDLTQYSETRFMYGAFVLVPESDYWGILPKIISSAETIQERERFKKIAIPKEYL